MIDEESIIKIYSNSLFQVSQEENIERLLFSQMSILKSIFNDNMQLIKILKVPTINKFEKREIIDKIFQNKFDIHIVNFIKILIDSNRISLLLKIIDYYKKLYYKKNNIVKVTVILAIELTDIEKEDIVLKCERLLGKQVIVDYIVDKTIIGGIIIKTIDCLYDMSIKNKLDNIKNSILNVSLGLV